MNNTLLRKSIQTHIRKYHNDMKNVVSDKLLHHDSTAEKYYNVIRKGEAAAKTSHFIAEVFKGHSSEVKSAENSSAVKNPQGTGKVDKRWSDYDETILMESFSDLIKSGEISMENVKAVLEKDARLTKFTHNPKRVLDKLRYLRKAEKHPTVSDHIEVESFNEKMARNGFEVYIYIYIF